MVLQLHLSRQAAAPFFHINDFFVFLKLTSLTLVGTATALSIGWFLFRPQAPSESGPLPFTPPAPAVLSEITEQTKAVSGTKCQLPGMILQAPEPVRCEAYKTSHAIPTDTFTELVDPTTGPSFPGGDLAMIHFLHEHLAKQPAFQCHYRRVIVVRFTVDTFGALQDIIFLRSAGADADKIITDILQKMPCWTPAKWYGAPINADFTFPIRFCFDSNTYRMCSLGSPNNAEAPLRKDTFVTSDVFEIPSCFMEDCLVPSKDIVQQEVPVTKYADEKLVQQEHPELQIAIWPNPTTGPLHIQIIGQPQPLTCLLVHSTGQVLYQEQLSDDTGVLQRTLDMADFPAGICVLRVEQAGKVYTKKMLHIGNPPF
jgi:hypothetical protein